MLAGGRQGRHAPYAHDRLAISPLPRQGYGQQARSTGRTRGAGRRQALQVRSPEHSICHGGLSLPKYAHGALIARSVASGNSPMIVHNGGLGVVAETDRPPQRPGVDQDRDNGLRHADQSQHQKFGIVEQSERFDAGSTK